MARILIQLFLLISVAQLYAQKATSFEPSTGLYVSVETGISVFQPDDSEVFYEGKKATPGFRFGLGYQTRTVGLTFSWRRIGFPYAEDPYYAGQSTKLVSSIFGLDAEAYFGGKNQFHCLFGLLAGRHTEYVRISGFGQTFDSKKVTRSNNGIRIALGYARMLRPDLRLLFDVGIDGVGIQSKQGYVTYDAGYFNFTLGAQYNFQGLF